MEEFTIAPLTGPLVLRAALLTTGFFAVLFVGAMVLPGPKREGFPQPNGDRKTYRLTGLSSFLGTNAAAAVWLATGHSLSDLLRHFWSYFVVANVVAVLITAWLFVVGRRRRAASSGTTEEDAWWKDLWFGPELNPTLFGVDLKMFMYQPSLIGLWLMNVAFVSAQLETYGAVSIQMWIYQAFVWAYLFTHYVREDFMLSTWDIIAERFGFMLVWGDLVYVPFLYSLCGWWVLDAGWTDGVYESPPIYTLVALVLFHLLSHWVFRGSNWQKDRFKRDPSAPIWGKPPETLNGRLLISGFWGIGRKINYTGEIGVYLSFALCAGFEAPWPYVLPATLVVLLTQRAGRDDRKCRKKYGALWAQYCQKARFRIIPFVY